MGSSSSIGVDQRVCNGVHWGLALRFRDRAVGSKTVLLLGMDSGHGGFDAFKSRCEYGNRDLLRKVSHVYPSNVICCRRSS